jgi:outer membrane murein-binding lipoprotein Lpp
MAKLTPVAAAIVFGCLVWPGAGHAATDDLAALRAELEALKSDYTSRVQALEARIKQLESAGVTATTHRPGRAAMRRLSTPLSR